MNVSQILPILILSLGPATLILLIWRGCLRRDALVPGPSRRVGLVPADLLIALGLMILGPSLVHYLMPGTEPGQAEAGTVKSLDSLAFAYRALLAQASGQLPPVLYLFWRASFVPRGLRLIGLVAAKPWRDLRWGVLGFVFAVPMIMATIQSAVLLGGLFGQEAPQIAHDMLKMLLDSDSLTGSVLIIVSAVLIAPILEEGIFRGIVQSVMVETLGESRRWSIVIVAAIVFMFIHADFATWEHWQALPGLLVLGLVLGWLYERTGSLWPSILVHTGFNLLNILLVIAVKQSTQPTP